MFFYMNKYDEAANFASEQINEFELEKRRKRRTIKITVISICCVCLVLLIGVGILKSGIFMPTALNKDKSNIGDTEIMDTLTWNIKSTAFSRTGFISPFTSDCKEEKISRSDFCKLFSIDGCNKILPDNSKQYVVLQNGKLHSVIAERQFENGKVTIIIDPNCCPEFLFSEEDKTQTVNGYLVSAHKSAFNADAYEIDVGLKKDGVGVWIIGNSQTQECVEALLYAVLNSEMDFSEYEG